MMYWLPGILGLAFAAPVLLLRLSPEPITPPPGMVTVLAAFVSIYGFALGRWLYKQITGKEHPSHAEEQRARKRRKR